MKKSAGVALAVAGVGVFIAVALSRLKRSGERGLTGNFFGPGGHTKKGDGPKEELPGLFRDEDAVFRGGKYTAGRKSDPERPVITVHPDTSQSVQETIETLEKSGAKPPPIADVLTAEEREEVRRAAERRNKLPDKLPVTNQRPREIPTVDQIIDGTYDTEGLPKNSGGPTNILGARNEVRNVARHIYNAGGGYQRYKANPRAWAERAKGSYSRKILMDWQMKAGLEPDGLYGPNTRRAMLAYGAPNPPPPLFVLRRPGTGTWRE